MTNIIQTRTHNNTPVKLKHARSFLERVHNLAEMRGNCDVLVLVGSHQIPAHSFMLDMNSTIMSSTTVQEIGGYIGVRISPLFDKYPGLVYNLIRSFYSGKIDLNNNTVRVIHKFAVTYSVVWLRDETLDMMRREIDDENAMFFLGHACSTPCDELMRICFSYFSRQDANKLVPIHNTLQYDDLQKLCSTEDLTAREQVELIVTWYEHDSLNRFHLAKDLIAKLNCFGDMSLLPELQYSFDDVPRLECSMRQTYQPNNSMFSKTFNLNITAENTRSETMIQDRLELTIISVDCTFVAHDDSSRSPVPVVYCAGVSVCELDNSNLRHRAGSSIKHRITGFSRRITGEETLSRAGIGVYWGPDHPLNVSEGVWGKQSTKRAELWSAIRCVQLALTDGMRCIEIRSDSKYLVKGVGRWRKRWGRRNGSLFRCLDKLLSMIDVKWVYVESGCHGNSTGDSQCCHDDTQCCHGDGPCCHGDGPCCHGDEPCCQWYQAAVELAKAATHKSTNVTNS